MSFEIEDLNEVKQIIEKEMALLVYFYSNSCSSCFTLRPKVEDMILEEFPKMKMVKVNAMLHPEIPAHYSVYSSPTIIILFEGKEYIRKSQYISVSELSNSIKRLYELMF